MEKEKKARKKVKLNFCYYIVVYLLVSVKKKSKKINIYDKYWEKMSENKFHHQIKIINQKEI